jgi:hypothetical protein
MNEDDQVFKCRHCGVTERYDREPFYLLAWWAASEAFDQRHAACATAATSQPADAVQREEAGE